MSESPVAGSPVVFVTNTSVADNTCVCPAVGFVGEYDVVLLETVEARKLFPIVPSAAPPPFVSCNCVFVA